MAEPRRRIRVGILGSALLSVAVSLQAQTTETPAPSADRESFIHSGSFGLWIAEGERIGAFEFRSTKVRQKGVGFDFGVALPPEAVGAGALVLGVDFGGALSFDGGSAPVVRGGLWTVMLLGDGGMEPGLYLGVSQFTLTPSRRGLRFDATFRVLAEVGVVWSFGMGFAV